MYRYVRYFTTLIVASMFILTVCRSFYVGVCIRPYLFRRPVLLDQYHPEVCFGALSGF